MKGRVFINNNISFTRVESCVMMEPRHSNLMENVHGGELMKIMDNTAGIVAVQYGGGFAVTARVDEIVFLIPIHVGNVVTCIAQLAYTGKTSMQIFVKVLVHDVCNYSQPELALTAFFTMVHLVDGKPAEVPKLLPTTKEEEELYKLGEKKYYEIKQNKQKYKEHINKI